MIVEEEFAQTDGERDSVKSGTARNNEWEQRLPT